MDFTTYDLDDVFTFGKHAGQLVSDVAEHQPSYILWASDNIEWLEFTEDVLDEARINYSVQTEDWETNYEWANNIY